MGAESKIHILPGKKIRKRGRRATLAAVEEIRALLDGSSMESDHLIEHLHLIQDKFGCLSADHMSALAELMRLSMAEVYETATFYHHFDVVKDDSEVPPKITVRVCDSVTCAMLGSEQLLTDIRDKAGASVRVVPVPCVGRCAAAPVAVVGQNAVDHADAGKVCAAISASETKPGKLPLAVSYRDYVAGGGYQTYKRCLSGDLEPEQVMDILDEAGLRGLGGAGFPAGKKWRIVRSAPAPRILAVNIDEGEPGTFKDRHYLESDPHRFIEGSLIASWAVGIESVYIYLRDEYASCRELLRRELDTLRLEADFAMPTLHLRRGAGAYICGEESAMIESIEGKRGMPRLRPPYVAQVGVFGSPTLEHNMETLHWVRNIIEHGPKYFSGEGRNGRSGLRSFSVSGRVNKPGVHLAPAGITVSELIEEFCGGMLDGHKFYAYLPGGASGGILPAEKGDIPLDFDTLQHNDSDTFIGSAAVIILSDQDRARDAAINVMRFFEHESCGQCTPCRVGTAKAVKLMEAEKWDVSLLEELSAVMSDASICGLGQAAPNPIRCVLKHFRNEVS